ncbi:SH3 domain-containing protein [Fulvimarina pelagi]|uniref:SH3 domain-containing protein n=1 Tax=Fulvimarina pelagi TaxID=217511 RepID=UPI0002DBBF1B|nr:SH3 domain-containing protein [Fulvimarina pelagi]
MYELQRTSGPSYQRWGRSFFEEPEDISRAAPIWQRYPIFGFMAGAFCLFAIIGVGAVLATNWSQIASLIGLERQSIAGHAVVDIAASEHAAGEERADVAGLIARLSRDDADIVKSKPVEARHEAPIDPPAERELGVAEVQKSAQAEITVTRRSGGPETKIAVERLSTTLPGDKSASVKPGVDGDLVTGGIKPASDETSVLSLLDRAKAIEAKTGTVWPGLLAGFAEEVQALRLDERITAAIAPPMRERGMQVPVPAFKADLARDADTADAGTKPIGELPDGRFQAGQPGFAKTHVNMRDAPEMDAGILTVLSEGAPLTVMECGEWCKVRFEASEGYVYGTYVGTGEPADALAGEVGADTL